MTILQVTNNSESTLEDKFDGITYVFAPGDAVTIDEDVARHIFGYGDSDKIPYLQRLGWLRHSAEVDQALAKLNQFSFATGEVVFKPVADNEALPSAQADAEATPKGENPFGERTKQRKG